ncbi:hypothetical protein IT774_16190 [Salinimonas marina]|uniref:Catalase n=1 Tax=Salinimonas marina TaxID=2785918 RepID=A0A7S9HCW6_9ALTE|nr:putative metalloprotease CJM1_0395 family protein [Salinimonas marina]QPG05600.1 hypothetical protein IT774_16190 [Salinimonas marina]
MTPWADLSIRWPETMNIVTPLPTALALPTANMATEAARRDNLLRESIPANPESDKNNAQKGLGSEGEQARASLQKQVAATYDKPQSNPGAEANTPNEQPEPDTAGQQSSGRDSAEQRQQQQAKEAKIAALKQRDQEVRVHEQAHAVAGGQYAGAPKYEYTTGPDNQRYVTDGEVSIDVSEAATAQQTIEKMRQVRRAALAPAEPSMQDRTVAAQAAATEQQARSDLAGELAANPQNQRRAGMFSDIDAWVDTLTPAVSAAISPERPADYDETSMQARRLLIQQTYRNTYQGTDAGFTASA